MAKNSTKNITLSLALVYAIWYFSRKPRISILNKDAATGTISYKMSINGKSITDTIRFTDMPQFIAAGDGTHIFAAIPNNTFGTLELSIGYMENGGYKSIKSLLLSIY